MISVILCTYNREKYLKRCLESLADQTAKDDLFEIVIVNNVSPDSTEELCQKFINNHPKSKISYVVEIKQGHTFARNRGIKESKGNILTFIDDDAFVHKNYIESVIQAFRDQTIYAIGGKIIPLYETGVAPKWMSKYLLPLVSALDLGDHQKDFGRYKHPIGANMAFRKEVFDRIGVFDEELGRRGTDGLEGGDEKDLFVRMKTSKMRIIYAPKVMVDHIIGRQRTTEEYVKGLAIGVGRSERKRLNRLQIVTKWLSECIKIGASIILFVIYSFKGRFEAAIMLLRFRFWVLKGLLE